MQTRIELGEHLIDRGFKFRVGEVRHPPVILLHHGAVAPSEVDDALEKYAQLERNPRLSFGALPARVIRARCSVAALPAPTKALFRAQVEKLLSAMIAGIRICSFNRLIRHIRHPRIQRCQRRLGRSRCPGSQEKSTPDGSRWASRSSAVALGPRDDSISDPFALAAAGARTIAIPPLAIQRNPVTLLLVRQLINRYSYFRQRAARHDRGASPHTERPSEDDHRCHRRRDRRTSSQPPPCRAARGLADRSDALLKLNMCAVDFLMRAHQSGRRPLNDTRRRRK
jgi:hypothetical protein